MIDQRPTVVLYNDEQFVSHITYVEGERQKRPVSGSIMRLHFPRLGKSRKAETQAAEFD